MSIDKRRKSDNLVLIQSIKNDLRRILAKRNSLSLTDLNDDDDEQLNEALLVQQNRDTPAISENGVKHKTARSLSALPAFNADRLHLRNPKWLKLIGSKATQAIKKSIENLLYGYK